MPDLTTRTEVPTPIVVQPGTIVPGRARGASPLRREGPAKLTGAAKYADDLVFPGAWFGATIRSTDAHARFVALDLDPAFDWSTVVVVTGADIPGDNIVSSIKEDQPILVPLGGEIQHHAEPLALLAAPDRATLRAARHAVTVRSEPLLPVFDPEGEGLPQGGLPPRAVLAFGSERHGLSDELLARADGRIAIPMRAGVSSLNLATSVAVTLFTLRFAT